MAQQPTRHSILPSSRSSSTQHQSQSQHQSALSARIAQKRAELQHLQQLRDLSANLASQMTELETKLGTLRDGAEAVACVMRNWEGVLGVISMAGAQAATYAKEREQQSNGERAEEPEGDLPVTLVRIPVEGREETGG